MDDAVCLTVYLCHVEKLNKTKTLILEWEINPFHEATFCLFLKSSKNIGFTEICSRTENLPSVATTIFGRLYHSDQSNVFGCFYFEMVL